MPPKPLTNLKVLKKHLKSQVEGEIISLLSLSSSLNHLTQIHARVFAVGVHQNNEIAAALLSLYTPHSTSHTSLVFHHILNPSLSLFNAFLRSLSFHSLPFDALCTYSLLKLSRIAPDRFTFPSLLKSLSFLPPHVTPPLAPSLHADIIRFGLQSHPHTSVSLIDFYSKSGLVHKALQLFEEMPIRDTASWNCVIAAFFRREDVDKGRELFERMPVRNVVSWNTVIAGCAQNGRATEAIGFFRGMQADGVRPNKVTVIGVLLACAQAGTLDVGRWVHRYAESCGVVGDVLVSN